MTVIVSETIRKIDSILAHLDSALAHLDKAQWILDKQQQRRANEIRVSSAIMFAFVMVLVALIAMAIRYIP